MRTVFISYCHKDLHSLNQLKEHINPLLRYQGLEAWDDTRLVPGSDWKVHIKKALESADVAVLLVTPAFLASKFIAENELPPILTDFKKTVLWVAVKHSMYQHTPLAEYQAANDPARPIAKHQRRLA